MAKGKAKSKKSPQASAEPSGEVPSLEKDGEEQEAPTEEEEEKPKEDQEEPDPDLESKQEVAEESGDDASKQEAADEPPEEAAEAEGEAEPSVPDLLQEEAAEKGDKKKKKGSERSLGKGGKKKGKKGKKAASSEASLGKGKKGKKGKKDKAVEGGDQKQEDAPKEEEGEPAEAGDQEEGKPAEAAEQEEGKPEKAAKPKKGKPAKGAKEKGDSPKKKKKPSEEGAKKKKKKKKKSEALLEGVEPKKKKKGGKGKKTKETPSATETEQEVETPKKDKKAKKGKKGKKSKAASQGSLPRDKAKKKGKKSVSEMSLKHKKTGKSQPSLQQLMSKLTLHASEMRALRSKSSLTVGLAKEEFEWESTASTGTEDSDYIYEVVVEDAKAASEVFDKPKGKKGKKGKGKKVKMQKEKGESSKTTMDEKKPKKKKKGKGKGKGKKKKREPKPEEEEETEATVEPQDDVLAEITRMKYLAELEASGEETEAETTETQVSKKKKKEKKKKKKKKEKKPPKKKLTKMELARIAADQADYNRKHAAEDAFRAAQAERLRIEEERRAGLEKERKEQFEQQVRTEQLEANWDTFKEIEAYTKKLRGDAKMQKEWEYYVGCGRLPTSSKCDQMNTFLHLWENTIQETSMEEAAKRTQDVLELLTELDDLIDTVTVEKKELDMVENWKWVTLLFRQQQAKSLDVATYRLLRNIEKNLHRIDIPTADYQYHDDNIALCLWLRIQLPVPLPNPRRPPKPRIEVDFPQMKMEVQFPWSIDGEKTAVRALYVKYDHLSDLSASYDKPPIPEYYDVTLLDATKKFYREKMLYKYKHRVKKISQPEEEAGENPPEPPPDDTIPDDEEVPVVPYRKLEPSASTVVLAQEEAQNVDKNTYIKEVPPNAINLRKYCIMGGVYSLNLIHQPPQPQDFVTLEMNLTPLYLPKQLELVNLCLDYNPPVPPEPGLRRAPEEIEEDMKKQEEEMEKLILVTLTWPEHVIFLELPMVCFWDDHLRVWTRAEVNDLKHNEEKGQLSFRSRKGGTFALAVYRYANLPYQAWELKPETDGSVSLQITAAILMVEFKVKDGLVALSQLQNSPNNALQDIIGTYFPLPKLIRMLQTSGVDVFPAFDTFCYVENTCEKHWPMEKHLYFNMAQLSTCFNFAWSRWNLTAGLRNAILQMREYRLEKTKQKSHMMLHVTPINALFVDCTEVSQTFNEEGIENMKFYPDLFYLMKGTSGIALKNKVAKASKELIFALYELLIATRVMSFS